MAASPYCPHCGALNPSEEKTCFACGHALSAVTPTSVAVSAGLRLLRQRYRIVKQIGAGGFAAVYQAEDTQLGNRLVAVKEMSARGLTPEEVQEATESFHREALLLARLSHPNLPRIYEQFEEAGRWYLVMDFIAGETLEEYLARQGGSLPVKEALQLGLQLTNVLGYLHTRQPPIVFRDLKPSNVMRVPDGTVYLIDFGIARLFKPGQQKDTIAFGSPGYAAPEQYGKAQTTPRSDVFSLGALLHQMLTGIDPSDTPFRFKPLAMPRPAGLSTLIERMVDLDVAKRPASMDLVRDDLERMLNDPSPWRVDEQNTTLPGASLRLTQSATGAFPALAPAPPVWQAPPPQGGPVMTPQPAAQKKKKAGCGGWIVLLVVGAIILANVAHHNTDSSGGDAPGRVVPVHALSWSRDGSEMAFGGDDGHLELWSVGATPPTDLDTGLKTVNALAWAPNSYDLAVAGDVGRILILTYNGETTTAADYSIPSFSIDALAWSPDGNLLALAGGDGSVRVVDAYSGKLTATYQADNSAVLTVAWSPNGAYIAFGGGDQTVQIWDTSTRKPYKVLHDAQGGIEMVAWSITGQILASGDASGHLQLWNPKTGSLLFSYPNAGSAIRAIAWSPDDQYLAANGGNYTVQVWKPNDISPVYTYTQHSDTITAVAWSAEGYRIASASYDGTVQVWDAFSGKDELTYQQS
jgi:tRNA A-37 threonylcarbamoyl transferase component Bud32